MKFYLDECLPYVVAEALRMVGYEITDHKREQKSGLDDENLIRWLGQNHYIWITKHHVAKRHHAEDIRRYLLRVVWVRGLDRKACHDGVVSSRMLHRMLTDRLDDVASKIATAKGPRYFVLSMKGNRVRLDQVLEESVRADAPLRTVRQKRRRRR